MKAPLMNKSVSDIKVQSYSMYSHEAGGQENNGINDPNDPLVSACPDSLRRFIIKTKGLREAQIGAVGSSLIPALGRGSNGT